MESLTKKQNQEYYISLLKAQNIVYSQAKLYQIFDLVSILIAIVLPIIAIYNPKTIEYISGFGVIWTVTYLIAENFRKSKTIIGAKIQEQFDTDLFNINWNRIFVGDKINSDIIYDLQSKNKENERFKNWYSTKITDNLPNEIQIILCQRINSSWELDLRKRFVKMLITLTTVYYVIFLYLLIKNNVGLFDALLLLSPSISFLIYSIQHSIAVNNQANSKKELLATIDDFINEYSTNKNNPTEIELRQIQDSIFSQRTVPEKVPDWFYNLFRKYNENKTDKLIENIISKF